MSQKPSDTQLTKTGQLVLTGYIARFFAIAMVRLIIQNEDVLHAH